MGSNQTFSVMLRIPKWCSNRSLSCEQNAHGDIEKRVTRMRFDHWNLSGRKIIKDLPKLKTYSFRCSCRPLNVTNRGCSIKFDTLAAGPQSSQMLFADVVVNNASISCARRTRRYDVRVFRVLRSFPVFLEVVFFSETKKKKKNTDTV
jgi:hypothetical protein